jgi:hypothetical protein
MATAKPGPLTEILQQLSQGLEQVSKNVNEARTKHEARLIDPTNLQKKFPNLFQLHTNQEDTVTTAKPYTYDDFIANNPFRAKSTTDPKDELIAQLQKKAKNRKTELKKLNDTVLKTKAIAQSRLERLDSAEIDLEGAQRGEHNAKLDLAQSEGIKNVLDQRVRALISEKDAVAREHASTVFRLQQQLRQSQANNREALQLLAKARRKVEKFEKKAEKRKAKKAARKSDEA